MSCNQLTLYTHARREEHRIAGEEEDDEDDDGDNPTSADGTCCTMSPEEFLRAYRTKRGRGKGGAGGSEDGVAAMTPEERKQLGILKMRAAMMKIMKDQQQKEAEAAAAGD